MKFYKGENGIIITKEQKDLEEITANTVDAALEKHVPVYEVEGNQIHVKVGEVAHPMEEVHYIEWIALITKDGEVIEKKLQPNDAPEATFDYVKEAEIFAYCNLHGLWKTTVE